MTSQLFRQAEVCTTWELPELEVEQSDVGNEELDYAYQTLCEFAERGLAPNPAYLSDIKRLNQAREIIEGMIYG